METQEQLSMQKVACVKLYDKGPSQLYAFERIGLAPGDFCVVDCEGEEATGLVAGVESHCSPCHCDQTPYSTVLRKANDQEIEDWRRLKEREHQALIVCKDKVRQHNLPMSISSVRISEKQNKVTFRFTADRRIDFRELVKDLAGALKARIELWQIGVRDEARNMDGYGICGRRLCCAAWIRDFKAITIRMAKHQELALSPSKLSGLCGRLMCCIQYEDEQYRRMQEEMPPLGAVIESRDVTGEVIDRHALGQWMAVRDAAGSVFQVFNREVVRVVSKPSRGDAAESSATGGEGADDAIPEEDEENAPRSSRRHGAGYSGGSAPHAEAPAYRGGIPPRPPSALKREEEARHAHEQKGMDRKMADLTARAARGEPKPPETERIPQPPAPAAAQARETAVPRESPPAISTKPQAEPPAAVESPAISASAVAPVSAAASAAPAAPAEERHGGPAPAAREERKEKGGHWGRRGRRGGRSRHKALAGAAAAEAGAGQTPSASPGGNTGTAANAVSGAPPNVPASSAASPMRPAGAPHHGAPHERAGGHRRRRPRHRPMRQGPSPAG